VSIGLFKGISPLPRLNTYSGSLVQRSMIDAVDSSNDQSIWSDANPSVQEGDFAVYDKVTQEGRLVTLTSDGIATIANAGSQRQSFFVAHYSRFLLDFTPNQKQYVNNVAPNGADQTLNLTVGIAINQNMASFFANPENDALTITVIDGQPPQGTSITNGVITGVPIIVSTGQFTLGAFDGIESGTCFVSWIVGPSSTGTTAGALVADDIFVKSLINGGLVR
jgi:hypothetical protein